MSRSDTYRRADRLEPPADRAAGLQGRCSPRDTMSDGQPLRTSYRATPPLARRLLLNPAMTHPAPTAANKTAQDYLWPRWLFLRALGLIFFSAFYALAFQMHGLIGERGILPAGLYLD